MRLALRGVTVVGTLAVALAACSTSHARISSAGSGASAIVRSSVAPSAHTTAIPRQARAGMAPGSCADVFIESVPLLSADQSDLKVTQTTSVGIKFLSGVGPYQVDDVRLAVLPPGSNADSAETATQFLSQMSSAVASTQASSLAVGTQSFTLSFDGRNAAGAALASGRYPVVFYLRTSGAPGSACPTSENALKYGTLMTVDWG
jgi:hypothetical protein